MKILKLIFKLKEMIHLNESKQTKILAYLDKLSETTNQQREVTSTEWCELFRSLELKHDLKHHYHKKVISEFMDAFKVAFIEENPHSSSFRKDWLHGFHAETKNSIYNIISLMELFKIISHENLQSIKNIVTMKYIPAIENALWRANELSELLILSGHQPEAFSRGMAQYFFDVVFKYINESYETRKSSFKRDPISTFDMFYELQKKAVIGAVTFGELIDTAVDSYVSSHPQGKYNTSVTLFSAAIPKEKKQIQLPHHDSWMRVFANYQAGDYENDRIREYFTSSDSNDDSLRKSH
jgi:hypothetical protein